MCSNLQKLLKYFFDTKFDMYTSHLLKTIFIKQVGAPTVPSAVI
jgi:hypothetical protein